MLVLITCVLTAVMLVAIAATGDWLVRVVRSSGWIPDRIVLAIKVSCVVTGMALAPFVWSWSKLVAESGRHRLHLLVPVLAGFAYLTFRWSRRKNGDDEVSVCAFCGYERPPVRGSDNNVCVECGRDWWGPRRTAVTPLTVSGWTTPSLFRDKARWWLGVLPAIVLVAMILLGPPLVRVLWGGLPTGLVSVIALHTPERFSHRAWVELFEHRTPPNDLADELLNRLTEFRDEPHHLPDEWHSILPAAIEAHYFSQSALQQFYGGSLEWHLEADFASDEGSILPRLHLKEFANTIELSPGALVVAVRVNGGAWQPVEEEFAGPSNWLAYSYEDFEHVGRGAVWLTPGSGLNGSRLDPSAELYYRGVEPIDVSELSAGDHIIEVRLHMVVIPRGSISHRFIRPDGSVAPHPDAIWHETRDLTATFTIPEPTR